MKLSDKTNQYLVKLYSKGGQSVAREFKDQTQVEQKRFDREMAEMVVIVLSFILPVPASASIARVFSIGWQPIMAVHLLFLVITIGIALYRKKLPLYMLVHYIGGLFFILAIAGTLSFGLIGFGIVLFVVATLFYSMFLGLFGGLVSALLSVTFLSCIPILLNLGLFSFNVNFQDYAVSSFSWFSAIVAFLFVCVVAIAPVGRLKNALSEYSDRLRDKSEDLENARKYFENLSNTDALTGLKNRRFFFEIMSHELKRRNRYRQPLSLFYCDIDHFKKVNDTYGHNVGDEVLRDFARQISRACRDLDIVARLGGEEFAVMLLNTPVEDAADVADRLRKICRETPVVVDGASISYTLSVGVTQAAAVDDTTDILLARSDAALYKAKRDGRDRTVVKLAEE
jgi:diguanylate cyclase (GGDEF)-like protein